VLAGLDALTYFMPYWDYRMAALRGGHIPLWNRICSGTPFLANIQAAVLYRCTGRSPGFLPSERSSGRR